MSQPKIVAPPSGLNVQDILYVLFRHKWKILLCAAIGIGAAAAVFLRFPTIYESQAKLLVRYIMDTSAIDRIDSSGSNETLINSEVEILTSWDLAMEVAKALVAERLLPQSAGGSNITNTAGAIRSGLNVTARGGRTSFWFPTETRIRS